MSPRSNLNSWNLNPLEVAEKLASSFVESWNHHDMASFAELFQSEASFVNVIGLLMKGRKEIEHHHAAAHAGPFRTSTLQLQVEDARETWLRIYEAHFMAMRAIRVASAGRSLHSFSSCEKTGGESLLLRTPTFHPHRADRSENPTFHSTFQTDTTGQFRHHRTKTSDIFGPIRRHRTSPAVCFHLSAR